jgi:anaerobic magnesium-protoporphyrin IX monomethyl ester cyclase
MLFPPLGAASLAAQLRELEIETRIFDCTFKSFSQIQRDLNLYQPDIIGIYSMISISRNAFRIAETTRTSFPNCLIVAGGPLPTLYPENYSGYFDAVFRGETDLSFPRFCLDFFTLKISRYQLMELPLESYEGLFIQQEDLLINNPTVHYQENVLQKFPHPDRRDFDHAAYQKAWLQNDGTKTTSIITTLGCPFNCDFCSKPVFGSLFRRRNLDAVFDEIEQIRSLGYDSLWIADDTLTLNFAHLEAFCTRMASSKISWNCLSRSTGIDENIAGLMKEAGCQRVYLGLETGNQSTLELMNKKATVEDGVNAVHKFHSAGIEVAAFFIVGYPGETVSSIEETFQLALTLPLDEISFNVPFPLPGSKLFERVSDLDKNQDWTRENEVNFVYKSEFDEKWLRSRIEQTMKAFTEKTQ